MLNYLYAILHCLFQLMGALLGSDLISAAAWIEVVTLRCKKFPALETEPMSALYKQLYKRLGSILIWLGVALQDVTRRDPEAVKLHIADLLISAERLLESVEREREVRPLSPPTDPIQLSVEHICSGKHIYPLPFVEELTWRRRAAQRKEEAIQQLFAAKQRRRDVDEMNAYGQRYFGISDLYQQLIEIGLRPIDVVNDGAEFRLLDPDCEWDDFHTDYVVTFENPFLLLKYVRDYIWKPRKEAKQ